MGAGDDETTREGGLSAAEADGASRELDPEEIPETDIVFECPHCGKSLSIDPRGAGLVIRCTQCQEPVTVPIPEGMEIEDFDATPEELSAQLLNTRQGLARAQKRVAELEAEVALLRAFRDDVERRGQARKAATETFRAVLARALKEGEAALATLRDASVRAPDALAIPPEAPGA